MGLVQGHHHHGHWGLELFFIKKRLLDRIVKGSLLAEDGVIVFRRGGRENVFFFTNTRIAKLEKLRLRNDLEYLRFGSFVFCKLLWIL